jgi:YVTN family beta-propeller protein
MTERTKIPAAFGKAVAVLALMLAGAANTANAGEYLSPTAITASPDGKFLYVACATTDRVIAFDAGAGKVAQQWRIGASPSGVAISSDGKQLYVTCESPESMVAVVDAASGRITRKVEKVGHTTMAPVISTDGKTLYVCNRFNNEVAFIDLDSGAVRTRINVPREPVSAAVTPDGKLLFVANHIHAGRADGDVVASSVSVIDTASGKLTKGIKLVNGSGLLRGVAISPDGKHVCVTHLVARFHLPTTQIERGWINTSGLTIIDVASLKPINTVLLDNIDSGAANPWAVAWTADGKKIIASHAGTHEISVIDAPALLAKLAKMPVTLPPGAKVD